MKKLYKFLFVLAILPLILTLFNNISAFGGEIKNTVYLTFDDGPSKNNTASVLDILNKNGVKGSFFVVGQNAMKYKENLKNLQKSGMGIYPHCNVHTYSQIYKNKDAYFYDLNCCKNNLKNVLGNDYDFKFVRLPGGATNEVSNFNIKNSILKELDYKGINYIDWNVDSGDAEAVSVSTNKLKSNFKKNCGKYKVEVVLMHDTDAKDSTVMSLQDLINIYKSKGYEFKTLDQITEDEIDYLIHTKVVNRVYKEKK